MTKSNFKTSIFLRPPKLLSFHVKMVSFSRPKISAGHVSNSCGGWPIYRQCLPLPSPDFVGQLSSSVFKIVDVIGFKNIFFI